MAKIMRRTWTSDGALGKKVRHVAFGYTLTVNRKRERKFSSAWGGERDALQTLAERQQEIQAGRIDRQQNVRFGQVTERYLQYKADHGKRSLEEDVRTIRRQLLPFFGGGLPIRQLTSEKIAAFEEQRITQVSACTVRNELACLRHLLRLAQKKWGYLDRVPEIELPKAPEGRTRFLNQAEITRILQACSQSKKHPSSYDRHFGDQYGDAKRGNSQSGMGADRNR